MHCFINQEVNFPAGAENWLEGITFIVKYSLNKGHRIARRLLGSIPGTAKWRIYHQ